MMKSTKFFLRALVCGVLVTAGVFAFVSHSLWSAYRSFVDVYSASVRIHTLAGEIVHLDEVLTMSARMATATGDATRWEQRYRLFEPQLDSAIKAAVSAIPASEARKAAEQTDEANARLVAMENEGFELVRAGRQKEAAAILFSEDYETQKRRYSAGMETLLTAMNGYAGAQSSAFRRRALLTGGSSFVAMILLLAGWVSVVTVASRQMVERERTERALQAAHHNLENQVTQRTAELNRKKAALEEEIVGRQSVEGTLRETHVALQNAMPGISRLDTDGRYEQVNNVYAAMLGYVQEELVGAHWERTVYPDDHACGRDAYQKMIRQGTAEFEARAVRKDGTTFHKQVLMVKIAGPGGNLIGHHCFMRDITERKRAEAETELTQEKLLELSHRAVFLRNGTIGAQTRNPSLWLTEGVIDDLFFSRS
ncbi:MAG: PAS domain S-box protein [Planctomycetota bacterium]